MELIPKDKEQPRENHLLTERGSPSPAAGLSGGTPTPPRCNTHPHTPGGQRSGVRVPCPQMVAWRPTVSGWFLPVYEAVLPVSALLRQGDLEGARHRHPVAVPVHQARRGSPGQPRRPRLHVGDLFCTKVCLDILHKAQDKTHCSCTCMYKI